MHPILGFTQPRQDDGAARENTAQPTIPHSTRATHTEGHWAPVGGKGHRENATADRAKTSRARALSGAKPTPSAVQLSKTTGVPQVNTRARFHPHH